MIISIHQPNFMPWNPFFEKIQQSDLFVFLTHCQFEKGGYQNRFNYNNKWYTMSTSRGLIPIIDKILPLDETAEGHRLLEEREVFGKVIIQP